RLYRRGGRIQSPVESAECDQRRTERALREDDRAAELNAPVCGVGGEQPEDQDIRRGYQQCAPDERPFTKPGGFILKLMKSSSPCDEALDYPSDQTEESQFLCGGRIDRDPIRVLKIPPGCSDFFRGLCSPYRSLAHQLKKPQPRPAPPPRGAP